MRNLLLGFVLGLVVATAGFVGAEGFIDLQSGTMYQEVSGGLLNMNTGQFQPIAPLDIRGYPAMVPGGHVRGQN